MSKLLDPFQIIRHNPISFLYTTGAEDTRFKELNYLHMNLIDYIRVLHTFYEDKKYHSARFLPEVKMNNICRGMVYFCLPSIQVYRTTLFIKEASLGKCSSPWQRNQISK